MADRYQDRYPPAGDDYDRHDGSRSSSHVESDPLAELARLIGQTDPLATLGRANLPVQPQARPQPRSAYHDNYDPPLEAEESPLPSQPSWMQRAARQEPPPPQDDYPSAVHPLHRYAAPHPPAPVNYDPAPHYADSAPAHVDRKPDPSRYDEALYGGYDRDTADVHYDQGYVDDGYAYAEEHDEPELKRRGGKVTVVALLALAVFGVGGAFAYRTYTGTVRSGEPPIIRADGGPTKIVPAQSDGTAKAPDRMPMGDSIEKIISREEPPVDLSGRSNPRVVLPPMNQNGSSPSTSGPAPSAPPAAGSANGTLPNSEPRKIKTFSVRGDQADPVTPTSATPPAAPAAPVAIPAKPVPHTAAAPAQRMASANAPLSLSPQAEAPVAAESQAKAVATNSNPVQIAPSVGAASGSYLVQVSSQRSESDAQASFKALQGKFPSVLGSHAPTIRRADLGEKGIYYRAMVGPFGSSDEASQFCGNLKSAGGQCIVQRN